jgi:hypothetical protein
MEKIRLLEDPLCTCALDGKQMCLMHPPEGKCWSFDPKQGWFLVTASKNEGKKNKKEVEIVNRFDLMEIY